MGVTIRNVSRIREIQASLRELSRLSLEIGVFAGQAKTKSKNKEKSIDYARIASIHEFGLTINQDYTSEITGNKVQRKIVIPERSFIRSTFDEKQDEWLRFVKKRIPKLLNGQLTAEKLVSLLGEKIVRDIKEKIKAIDDPPNAPSTIAAKGSSSPLIQTGGLRKRVTYKVVSK